MVHPNRRPNASPKGSSFDALNIGINTLNHLCLTIFYSRLRNVRQFAQMSVVRYINELFGCLGRLLQDRPITAVIGKDG